MISILSNLDILDNNYGFFFEIFCIFNLIKKLKKDNLRFIVYKNWLTDNANNKHHFNFLEENNCKIIKCNKDSNSLIKIQKESDYSILTGTLDKDKIIFDSLDLDTRIFSIGLTTSKLKFEQFGKYLKIFKYLNNISFTEKNTCKFLNRDDHGLKLLQYCFDILPPILMLDLNDLFSKIDYNKKIISNYKNIFLLRESREYDKSRIDNIIKDNKDSYDLRWKRDNYNNIIPILLNSETFHVTDFEMFCLALSLKKKVIFYNENNYRYIDLKKRLHIKTDVNKNILNYDEIYKNIEIERKKSLDYLTDILSFRNRDYKYDNIEILKDIKRENTFNEILKKRDNKIYINVLDKLSEKKYEDIALITTFYGKNPHNINAVKLAIDLIYKYSNPLPKDWIFVEAQNDESECQFKYIKDKYQIKYIFKKIEGCYSREFYFNYGTKYTSLDKYLFMDADASCVESDWIKRVSEKLDKYDILMPFKYFYRSNEYTFLTKKNYNSIFQISRSFALNSRNKNSKYYYNPYGFPGIGIGITKKLFNNLNGLSISPSTMGDTPFLMQCDGNYCKSRIYLLYNQTRDIYRNGKLKQFHGINPKIYYVDNICYHINHGNVYLRSNRGHCVFASRLNNYQDDDINISYNEIKWKNNVQGYLHSKCLSEFNDFYIKKNLENYKDDIEFKNYEYRKDYDKVKEFIDRINSDSIKIATEIYNKECKKCFGSITNNNKLKIIIISDKLKYKNSNLLKTISLWKKYIEVPYEIILFNDNYFNIKIPTEFRKILVFKKYKSGNTLVVSPNINPFKSITSFNCLENTFNMYYNPSNNKIEQTWNSDCIYYNGDYSFLYNDYIEINSNNYLNISLSEFIIFEILKYNKKISNIEKYFTISNKIKTQMEYEYFNLLNYDET